MTACQYIMEQCWKIRRLADVPECTLSTIQARSARREGRQQQQLMVVQCNRCTLTLQRTTLPQQRLRTHPLSQDEPLTELQHVKAKATEEGATLFCGRCGSRVAKVGIGPQMEVMPHSLTMLVPEGPDPQLFSSAYQREPYCTLGALSGLSYRNIMGELQRLAYTKQSRYRVTLREHFQRLRGYEAKFKGLHNLILLNENSREGPHKPILPPSAQKLSFSKMMRSTTVEYSHSRINSKPLLRSRRRGSSSPVERH